MGKILGIYLLDGAIRKKPEYLMGPFATGPGLDHSDYIIVYRNCDTCNGKGIQPAEESGSDYNPQCPQCQSRFDVHHRRRAYLEARKRYDDNIKHLSDECARSIASQYYFNTGGKNLLDGVEELPEKGTREWEVFIKIARESRNMFEALSFHQKQALEYSFVDVITDFVNIDW